MFHPGIKIVVGRSVFAALLCLWAVTSAAQTPPGVESWLKRALSRMNKGDYASAIDAFDEAIAALTCPAPEGCQGGIKMLDPRLAYLLNNRAAAHFARGDHEAALNDLKRALQLLPRLATTWHNRGNALRERGALAEALAAYERCLELDPRNTGAWHNRGVTNFDRAAFAAALQDFDRALALDKRFAAAWNGRGLALHALGRTEEALAAFNRAVQIQPRCAAAYSNRAAIWKEKGDQAQALRDHNQALALDPQTPGHWNNRANLRFQLGDVEGAEADYTQALALRPNALIYHNRGLLRQARRQWREALEDYDRALELDPQAGQVWEDRGKLLQRLGRAEEAARDLAAAQRLQTQTPKP